MDRHDFATSFYHQLDAQTSCLFTYNTLIKILCMFRAYPAHLQEVVVIVYMQSLVLIPKTAYIQLQHTPPEDEQRMLETCRGF